MFSGVSICTRVPAKQVNFRTLTEEALKEIGRENIPARDARSFTCFTGTKVRILTQKAEEALEEIGREKREERRETREERIFQAMVSVMAVKIQLSSPIIVLRLLSCPGICSIACGFTCAAPQASVFVLLY